jgi:hypothetical protein
MDLSGSGQGQMTDFCKLQYTVRILRESPRGEGGRLWCGAGGMCTGGWTKGLLLVENSMTHQGVILLHTD